MLWSKGCRRQGDWLSCVSASCVLEVCSGRDSALKTVASRLSYVKSEPIIVTTKGERKFFVMEPLAEGSFFKLRSNRHDGAGFLCRKQPESDCWTASILEQIRMVTPAQTCIRLAYKAYINKLTFNFGALDPCVGEFYKSHRERYERTGMIRYNHLLMFCRSRRWRNETTRLSTNISSN